MGNKISAKKLAKKVESLKIGSGLDKKSEMGPLVTKEHLEKVRKAYLNLENDPLVKIVDSARTPEVIFKDVWKFVY